MTMTANRKNTLQRTHWIKSPWTVLAFIVLGGLFGYFFPEAGQQLSPVARIFIGLMQMCILPIMITAIISSLGKLIKSPGSIRMLKTLMAVILVGIFMASAVGIAVGLLGKPGSGLSQSAKASIGKMLFVSEKTTTKAMNENVAPVSDFFVKMVPTNIFSALSEGNSLRILIFSILLGIAIGLVPLSASEQAIAMLNALFEAFKRIIGWIMYALPFGLFCIFASTLATTGLELFQSLAKFILMIYIGALLLFVVYQVAIWRLSGVTFLHSFVALGDTYIVALATTNSFIALPSALIAVQKNLKMDEQTSNLIIPLGTVINRQGVVMCFSLTAVFLAQLYQIPLGPEKLIVIFIGSALAGMAALGRLGIAVSTLAFVLDSIGVPLEVAFVILFAIEVFVEPLTSLLIIQSNCATAAAVERYGKHHADTP
jgi:proton glutamate symport protein